MWLWLGSAAFAFRPTDGTDAGVADRGIVELELVPTELGVAGGEVGLAPPGGAITVGVAEGLELGVGGSPEAVGVHVKRRLLGTAGGAGLALALDAAWDGAPAFAPGLAVTLPAGAAAVHVGAGLDVRIDGVEEGTGFVLVEPAPLGRVGPVAQIGVGTADRGTVGALGGARVFLGPLTLDAGCGVVTAGGSAVGVVRAGFTAAMGPFSRAPSVAEQQAPGPTDEG